MQRVRKLKVVTIVAIAFGLVSGLSACNKSSGGGVMETGGDKKVTFGYQMRCDDVLVDVATEQYVAQATGQFQFKDRNNDVSFHGKIDSSADLLPLGLDQFSCQELGIFLNDNPFTGGTAAQSAFIAQGTYTPQPKKIGLGGEFRVTANALSTDPDFPDCIGGDILGVEIISGVYEGYTQVGCVLKGNISDFSE